MKRFPILVCVFVGLSVILVFLTSIVEDVEALPEYSTQTGEPCATCHISPSGGGSRTPRGQAWIADEKPGTVPELLSALELLGVSLDYNSADYTVVPDEIPPAQPLLVAPGQAELIIKHLSEYPGN